MYIENKKIASILDKYINNTLFNDMSLKNLDISCSGSFLHYFMENQYHLMKDLDFYPNNKESLNEIYKIHNLHCKQLQNSINVDIEMPFENLFIKENFKSFYGQYNNNFINIFDFYNHSHNHQYNIYIKNDEMVSKQLEKKLNDYIYQEFPKSQNNNEKKRIDVIKHNLKLSIITNEKFILPNIKDTVNKFDCCHVLWYYNLKTKQFFIKDTALLSLLSKFWIVNDETDTRLAKNIYMFDRIEKHKKRFFVHDYMLYKYMSLCFGEENVEELFYNYDDNEHYTKKEVETNFYTTLSNELSSSYDNFIKFYNYEFNNIKSYMIDDVDKKCSYKLYKDTLEIKLELFLMLKQYFPEYII